MIEALILECAIASAPAPIVRQIITVESSEDSNAININFTGLSTGTIDKDKPLGTEIERLVTLGANVDIGLMQINSQWLTHYDTTPSDLLDPCTNIRIGSSIFAQNLSSSKVENSDELAQIRAALSAYNTGSFTAGLSNGYVDKYDLSQYRPTVAAPDILKADSSIPFTYSPISLFTETIISFEPNAPDMDAPFNLDPPPQPTLHKAKPSVLRGRFK